MATQARLKELFDYKDGNLYRKTSLGGVVIGSVAGTKMRRGYTQIRVDGKLYLAHRLIWLYHHGYMPTMIDHIDSDPTNNNIENLRIATASQNQHNRVMGKNNTSGIKGLSVATVKTNGAVYQYWRAAIYNDYKYVIKTFKTKTKAIEFLNHIRPEIHGEYARFK